MSTKLRKDDGSYLDADDITGMVAAGGVDPLTEAAGAIGGTNNSDIPDLTATAAALTDNSAGTANTTLQALADGTTYATDVAAIRNNFADLAAMVNKLTADAVVLRAAARENAAKINELITALEG